MAGYQYDPKKTYLLQNFKSGTFISTYNDTWFGAGADGIRGTSLGHEAAVFHIVPKQWGLADNIVALLCNNYYVNRWHGGDSDGSQLGMYASCDEHSLWSMNFVEGKYQTVVF